MEPTFLTKEQVLRLHELAIRDFGGSAFLRDSGLLDSAIAQPESSFDGEYLHDNLYQMGAAYYYHISQNQPFSDGNKRTGKLCMQFFLELNGLQLDAAVEPYFDILIDVAEGRKTKQELATYIEQNCTNL